MKVLAGLNVLYDLAGLFEPSLVNFAFHLSENIAYFNYCLLVALLIILAIILDQIRTDKMSGLITEGGGGGGGGTLIFSYIHS